MQSHGPWTIVKNHQIYQDPWVTLQRDDVIRPDGLPGSYSTVEIKPGVTVVALDEKNVVHLTSEFHYAVGRITLEGVSGGIESGESALQSAQRELLEELGIIARKWTSLGTVDPFTSAVRSPVELYLAEELSFEATQLEGTELIERVSLPLADAISAVMESRITHAPTCVALLKIIYRQPGLV